VLRVVGGANIEVEENEEFEPRMDAKEHEWERRVGSRMKKRFALGRCDTLVVHFGGSGF
jgi:hypothetical protein